MYIHDIYVVERETKQKDSSEKERESFDNDFPPFPSFFFSRDFLVTVFVTCLIVRSTEQKNS